jgi:predicted HicB family RNase H-like nuclease
VVLDRFRHDRALNVRIPAELHRRLSVFCAQHEKTMKQFVIEALTEKLDKDEGVEALPSTD